MLSGPEALAAVRGNLTSYRVDPARMELLRTALKCYEGTQMYHNFTTGKHPTDANARRYVISFTCGEPFVDAASDAEWVLLSVVGQSFLLNQIRKMIGLASEVATGHVPISMMKDALSKQKVRAKNTYWNYKYNWQFSECSIFKRCNTAIVTILLIVVSIAK
jgi:tRNA pseudouridine38-40 synthase